IALRRHRLHVQARGLAVSARAVVVSRLAAVPAGLSGLDPRLRPARPAGLDRADVGAVPGLLLLHAATHSQSGTESRQHQLCVRAERQQAADLGAGLCLARRHDDRAALAGVLAHAPAAAEIRAEARMTIATPALSRPFSPLHFALREMRGGLRGFRIFVACIALGVMAIAGVGSFSRSLTDGLAREGRTILGGDIAFTLIHREAGAEEMRFLKSQGVVSSGATMRAMAGTNDGRHALIELKAVDDAYPLFGAVRLDPDIPLAGAIAKRGAAFGAAVDATLLQRLDL